LKKIDLKDKKILYELDLNARQSSASIGRKVGLSKDLVNRRIRRLINRGIVRYFYTIIDATRLGYLSCRLFIKFQYDNPEKEKEIVDFFVSNPYTWWVPSIEGQVDLAVILWARNTYEFYDILGGVLKKYKPFIKEYTPGIYARFHQYKRAYLLNIKKDYSEPILSCFREKTDFDDIDIDLLKIISNNARKPTVEIAKMLNLTPITVTKKIKNLIDNKIIQGFRAAIDLKKIGYRWYKILLDLEDITTRYQILQYAQGHPNIIYAYEVLGGHDIELEVEVENHEKLREILTDLRNRFSNGIRYYEHFLFYEEHKLAYMPMTV
jgi:DNA-binding Lrp family transcriptional regulator